MKQLRAYLLVFFIVATLGCKTSQSNNGTNYDLPITPLESTIDGGSSIMTEEEMKSVIFTEAVDAVIEMLNATNDCIYFKLEWIRDATKQVDAGMKYRLALIVQPVLVDPRDADCKLSCITEAIYSKQLVDASVVVQPEETPKHSIKILATSIIVFKIGSDGKMFLDCTPTLTLRYGWTQMTRNELVSPQFMKVVNKAMERFNNSATGCFRYKLDRVMEGHSTASPLTKYMWLMKVRHIYVNDSLMCRGWCSEKCNGVEIWKGESEITAQNKMSIELDFVQ